MVRLAKELQLLNAPFGMWVTELGMVTLPKELQLWKAKFPI